jgi:hypothetical protein
MGVAVVGSSHAQVTSGWYGAVGRTTFPGLGLEFLFYLVLHTIDVYVYIYIGF